MWKIALVAVISGLGFAPVATADGGGSAVDRCKARGETLAQNSRVRVFRVSGHRDPTFAIDRDYIAYGCLKHSGRTRKLGSFLSAEPTPDGVYAFTVGGSYAAYDRINCGAGACFGRFRVTSFRTGRTRLGRQIGSQDYMVRSDVVTRRGNAAWIRQKQNTERYSVHRLEHGHDVELDQGTGIDPKSLHRANGHVYWTHEGVTMSARLD